MYRKIAGRVGRNIQRSVNRSCSTEVPSEADVVIIGEWRKMAKSVKLT